MDSNGTMFVLSLIGNNSIAELWQLDVLGIHEPTEKKTKEEMANAVKDLFLQGKRLYFTIGKLERDDLFESYDQVLREWKSLDIIERVEGEINLCHFLPHRSVLKESSTTAIKPVFDT